ncbi:hypothetical protein M422DRAFT_230911 [Sphaerobolus stellatus SS14]|uniref:non-specific serine/threonine protein kinase n=1 Tax=Sphaerobolus stellatus (strain SS14) TaxID=990650 RepID=A0A0C9VMY6_SPHS4|nr:hypothetical protein M422DRAFT_230911 [Sphaerobolus stellatus SS14]
MQSEAKRIASFKTVKKFSRRSSIQGSREWPHPTDGTWLAHPESLAEAGFYHDPYALYPDNVTCFLCKEEYAEWEPHDNPHDIHIKISRNCPWALLRCALEKDKGDDGYFDFVKKVRIPTSRVLEKARLESYGNNENEWWPHNAPGHGCNAKAMAKAGFVFTPDNVEGDDTAACFYCDTSLSGWEAEDDPLVEHAKRPAAQDCAFIIALKEVQAAKVRPKGKRTTKAPPKKDEIREPEPIIISSDSEDEEKLKNDNKVAKKKSKPKPRKTINQNTLRAPLGGVDVNAKVEVPATQDDVKVQDIPVTKPKSTSGRVREYFGQYYTMKKLGSGTFGEVYLGIDLISHKQVAIKLESINAPVTLLHIEAQMYAKLRGAAGVPVMKWYSTVGDCNVLVLPVLGRSLSSVLDACGGRFSLPTVLMMADQLICRVQSLHSYGMIHRDLKPDNFLIGRELWDKTIYVIDLGMAKVFRNDRGQHIPYKTKRGFWGNARYASLGAHEGNEQSRRNDMEALAYIFIDCLKGNLPWPPIKVGADGYDDYTPVADAKRRLTPEQLCAGLPEEFVVFLKHAKALSFEAQPDYDGMRVMFQNLARRMGYTPDMPYDWVGR